jgi:outer membrane biosynthesis protein TonB
LESARFVPAAEGNREDDLASQRLPAERIAASLQGRSRSFADIIRTCYPAAPRKAGEEGRGVVAVVLLPVVFRLD